VEEKSEKELQGGPGGVAEMMVVESKSQIGYAQQTMEITASS